ncbi:hypothetical protein VTJ04DRAFT_4395 [Mycothermus thermophilus]|uniref:uncharacterized protein n=1 Tax=Humicola insolens TaxID=85995 RepID=UPI0037431534
MSNFPVHDLVHSYLHETSLSISMPITSPCISILRICSSLFFPSKSTQILNSIWCYNLLVKIGTPVLCPPQPFLSKSKPIAQEDEEQKVWSDQPNSPSMGVLFVGL